MKTIFDFGMFDAADTEYYLEQGFKVLAVEANPHLVASASRRLKTFIDDGTLRIINAAISDVDGLVALTISGDDLGSSSVYEDKVSDRIPLGRHSVSAIKAQDIISQYGVPFYIKVDIEGADRLVIYALTFENRPEYVSFEVGDDFVELLQHVRSIGFRRFKSVDQTNFRELANERNLRDRLARKIMRMLGYMEPMYVKRAGRFFKAGHSSGPVPWLSGGAWYSHDAVLERWRRYIASRTDNRWFDLHAS